jgi:adenosylcobinamide-GDP ribazoletransferase
VLFAANWGLSEVFPQAAAGVLTLALWVVIGGAIHLDGLVDTCDGLAGDTAERRLGIMSGSHAGAYGIAGAVVVLLMKYTAIVSLPEALRLESLLLAPVLGSWSPVLAVFAFPYARGKEGLGYYFKSGASWHRFALATLLMLAGSLILLGWQGLVIAAIAFMIIMVIGCFFRSRLGGLTGDVYGAIKEMTEALIFLLIPVIAGAF